MNLSKKMVVTFGILFSLSISTVTGLVVVKPMLEKTASDKVSLNEMKQMTSLRNTKLKTLEAGASQEEQAKTDTRNFLNMVPKEKDIESISRSVSTALTTGVSIKSFTFLNEEAIAPLVDTAVTLDGYKAPIIAVNKKGESSAAKKSSGFQRVPVVITVTASNYSSLAEYADALAKQPRLMNVISVDSTRGSGKGAVQATIYAYAFVYAS